METPTPKPDGQTIAHASHMRATIIGALLLVLILLLCGLYFWGKMLGTPEEPFLPPLNNEPETPRADADIQILKTVSGSDEVASIEADLNSTNLEGLDKELELIDRDLGN